MLKKMQICSLFSGVGGIELGFELTGKYNTIFANEIDKKAGKTYKENFENDLVIDDIRDLNPQVIPDIDVLTAGFPCTSFSIAGYQKGFEDEHTGDLFFETLRIIVAKKPVTIFLENVKNLVSHDNGKTFRVICEALRANGYYLKYQVLNAKDFGNVPQNRERIYIVGFKSLEAYKNFEFPQPIQLNRSLDKVIDFETEVDKKYYYTPQQCNFYSELQEHVLNATTLYQWRRKYVRENKSSVSPTLTANMGTGGHNVPILKAKHGIRKLTPRECFSLQGFPESFVLPTDLPMGSLYKQAGNSVVVTVITRIAENISRALEHKVCI